MVANVSVKRCCHCQKDVTNDQRMKDKAGKYWCVSCGAHEQKRKAVDKLVEQEKSKSKDIGKAHADRSRLAKMLGILALLAVGAAWSLTHASL